MLLIYLNYTPENQELARPHIRDADAHSWRAAYLWKGEIEPPATEVISDLNSIVTAYRNAGITSTLIGAATAAPVPPAPTPPIPEVVSPDTSPEPEPETEPIPEPAPDLDPNPQMVEIKDPNDRRRKLTISRQQFDANPETYELWAEAS